MSAPTTTQLLPLEGVVPLPQPATNDKEGNRGLELSTSYVSPGQPMIHLKYTLAEAFPVLEPDRHISLPETPTTPSEAPSSARSSACYGLTSVYVSSTPDSSPSSSPSRSQRRSSSPARSSIDSRNGGNTNKSPPRSRRTRSAVTTRSHPELHAARLQRSATLSTSGPVRKDSLREHKSTNPKRRSISSNPSSDSTPEHPGSNLTKMDDKWIIVQQKTFTKWSVTQTSLCSKGPGYRSSFPPP
jgi:hypothetical protein